MLRRPSLMKNHPIMRLNFWQPRETPLFTSGSWILLLQILRVTFDISQLPPKRPLLTAIFKRPSLWLCLRRRGQLLRQCHLRFTSNLIWSITDDIITHWAFFFLFRWWWWGGGQWNFILAVPDRSIIMIIINRASPSRSCSASALCPLQQKANVLKGWFLSPWAYWNHVNAICA